MIGDIPIGTLTPIGVCLLAVVLILMGWLVPRYVYHREIATSEKWQKAYETERTSRILLSGQVAEMLEQTRTSQKMMETFTAMAQRAESAELSGGGRHHVVSKAR